MPTILHHYTESELAKNPGDNTLVTDSGAQSPTVWELAASTNWGTVPPVTPGVMRLRLRLKRPDTAGEISVTTVNGTQDSWDKITEADLLQPGVWYEVTRLIRYKSGSPWLALITAWPGLRVDWINVETVDEAVCLLSVTPDRGRYDRGQSGTVAVELLNTTNAEQRVAVRATLESGLYTRTSGATQAVILPAPTSDQRNAGTDLVTVSLPLANLAEYGNGVLVEVLQGNTLLTQGREFCASHNDPLRVTPVYAAWVFIDSFTDANEATQIPKMRRQYAFVAEMAFWAPCENTDLAPDEATWRSGQSRLPMGKAPLQRASAACLAQGLVLAGYVDRWGFGWRVFKAAQKYPHLFEHELGDAPIHSFDVATLEEAEATDTDAVNTLGFTGQLPAAWGNPDALRLVHIPQLQASIRMFGWRYYRYDNGDPVEDECVDVTGRSLPVSGWTSAQVIRAIRAGVQAVDPRVGCGFNDGWNLEPKSLPSADDLFTAQVANGWFSLQEGETNGSAGHLSFSEEAARYTLAGRNVARYGGHQVNIINPYLEGLDHFLQAALTVAGGCHIAYGVREALRPLMQLVTRHSDLFFGTDLRADDGMLTVSASAPVLWEPFGAYRQIADQRKRQYIAHLVNAPNAKIGDAAATPDPVDNVTLTWKLKQAAKPTACYALTADGGYAATPLSYKVKENGKVVVTLPRLYRYCVVVLETSAKPLPGPAVRGVDPSTAPKPQLTDFIGVLGTGTTTSYKLPGGEPTPRSARAFQANATGSTVTSDGLRLGSNSNNFGFAPEVTRPGYYQVTVRAKSLAVPPTGATLSGLLNSAAGTVSNSQTWGAALFPAGQWVDVTLSGPVTYPDYWCALLGGWDGLVIDTIKVVRQRELTRAEVAATLTDTWGSQTVNTSSTTAWVGAGLHYADGGIVAALQSRGLTCTLAKAARGRGIVSLNTAFPSTPAALAGYRVVALHGIEARTLTPTQMLWLDHYVRGGGLLVVLGGIYGFGNGGWSDDPLSAGLLPVTCARGDLRNVNGTLTPVSALASSVSWSSPPTVPWCHNLTALPGATVELQAGSLPGAVSMVLESGRVLSVGVAPLGVAANPYWTWSQWTTLLAKLVFGS